ncbi:MAG: LD-carboxypeptidase [Prevotella sp.]|nr:LD-carboxypeptidase [Staphylococcus sp.]MCM1350649.1 LD-carboxypeptidase [Prevotella sp.]
MKCKRIQKGATLGIMCPSSRMKEPKKLEWFLQYLNQKGFSYQLGKSMFAKEGYLAGSDTLRADDLNQFFQDDEIDAILCFRGGYGAARFLDQIDYDQIKKHPKLLVGFSDVTVLLNAIYQRTGIPTLHGEMGCVFQETMLENEDASFAHLIDTLLDTAPSELLTTNYDVHFQNEGIVEGEIVGGNLCLVASLMGTPYEIDTKDKILLLEEVTEEPYAIDRYLCTLKLAHKLQEAKAILFGYFTDCDRKEEDGTQCLQDVLKDYTKDLTCPIVLGFPTGHNRPFVNVPIGVKARVDTYQKSVIVLESLFFDK